MRNQYSLNENTLQRFEDRQWFTDPKMNYFLSEILVLLNIDDETEMAKSFTRAMEACLSLQIPINRNFKRIYCYNGNDIIADWKMSALALYLIVINCNPNNELVAKAQLHFAIKSSRYS